MNIESIKNLAKQKMKIFLIFIFFSMSISIITITVDSFVVGNKTLNAILDSTEKQVKNVEKDFNGFIKNANNVLDAIYQNEDFQDYINNQKNISHIQDLFITLSVSQEHFMQLRYIDKNGHEKIKVDKNRITRKVNLITGKSLQDKSDRYYFKKSKNKVFNKVWFSSLDLNVENGKIEEPYNPTLRAILPIQKDGKFNGIIVINYFMNSFLNKIIQNPIYDKMIFDQDGYILKANNTELKWGKYNIKDIEPDFVSEILNNKLVRKNDFITFRLDLPLEKTLYLKLKLKKEFVEEEKTAQIYSYVIIGLITIFIAFIVIYFMMKIFEKILLNVEELRKLNEKLKIFEQMIENTNSGMITVDMTKKDEPIIYANNQFEQMTGYSKNEIIGKNCRFLQSNDNKQKARFTIREAIDQRIPLSVEIKNYKKDGTLFWNRLQIAPIFNEKNELHYYVGIQNDITETKNNEIKIQDLNKNLENKVQQRTNDLKKQIDINEDQYNIMLNQSKLAAKGEMVSMIAHQWRQPLTLIITILSKMSIKFQFGMLDEKAFNEDYNRISATLQELSNTVNDFSEFFKNNDNSVEETELIYFINNSHKLLDVNLKEKSISFYTKIYDLDKKYLLHTSQLKQVLLNLFKNSYDQLISQEIEDKFIEVRCSDNKEYLIIEVIDNGGGIPNKIIDNIFEPYFSTKSKNTKGISLYMSKMIIENQMNGSLTVHNDDNKAIFTIKLPKIKS